MKDGGPAFPALDVYTDREHTAGWPVTYGGMALRDYFAAKAMEGFLANFWSRAVDTSCYSDAKEDCARVSYELADAMLKAREE